MDPCHCGVEWEVAELGPERENLVVVVAEVFENSRSWIRDREMVEGTEKTHGGHCRKLLRSVRDHHLATPDIDTATEDTRTSCNEGRVKLGERHRDKVFQCRQVDGLVQGRLEQPRNAL